MLSLIPSHPQRLPLPGGQVQAPPVAARAVELRLAAGNPDRMPFRIVVVPPDVPVGAIGDWFPVALPEEAEPTWEDAAWQ
jgi:hypothetical protein